MKHIRDSLWSQDVKTIDTADLKAMSEHLRRDGGEDLAFFPHIVARVDGELSRRKVVDA